MKETVQLVEHNELKSPCIEIVIDLDLTVTEPFRNTLEKMKEIFSSWHQKGMSILF
ncbi:MAG: hypothetical protein HQM09_24305 [Candidatus Riflebacteria bacterium]|nr:hypothetical protein [Candidatus Riflebacteria bacterium]